MATPAQTTVPEPTRRRRWPWVLLLLILLLVLGAYVAAAWYASNLLRAGIRMDQPPPGDNLTVQEVGDADVLYSLQPSPTGWQDIGLQAMATSDGGWTQTSRPQPGEPDQRRIGAEQSEPALAQGQRGRLNGTYFYDNPKEGLGLTYRDVDIDTPNGPAPAWFVPGDNRTWAVFVHGRGASRAEGLRDLYTLAGQGHPTLLISYVNDPDGPKGDGLGTFGTREWGDLEAAVQYALDNGAKDVVLAAKSMGGAICLAFLNNSDLRDHVSGMWLDAPATNLDKIVDEEAARKEVPEFLTDFGKLISQWRFGIDFASTDYSRDVSNFDIPTTIVQGDVDTTVPLDVSQDYAEAVDARFPGTVDYQVFPRAGHTAAWNVDRPRYESLLTDLLARSQKD